MYNGMDENVVFCVRKLYGDDSGVRKVMDWISTFERSPAEITIDRFVTEFDIKRGEAIRIAKVLNDAGCGRFIIGRQGKQTRFVWQWKCAALGRAVIGENGDSGLMEGSLVEHEQDERPSNLSEIGKLLSIPEAKRLLSLSLGVEESAIEITIRA